MLGPLLFVALSLVPDAHPYDAQLAKAAERKALAPLDALRPLAAELWIVAHRGDGGPRVVFLPADARSPTVRWPWVAPLPRLLVHGPTHGLDPTSPQRPPTPWRELAVDSAEGLAFALLEAWLDPGRSDQGLDRWIETRAAKLMVEAPEASRGIAYRSALADFGAHLVSIANEVYRAADRARRRGADPCDWLTTEIPLFRLWRTGFENGAYPGRYPVPRVATTSDPEPGASSAQPAPRRDTESESEGPAPTVSAPSGQGSVIPGGTVWRTTRAVLTSEDKRMLVERLAPGAWTGDPRSDFRDLCGPTAGEA